MIAKITTDGKHILADIPYAGGAGRDKAHQIPGCHAHYVDEKFAYWRYPLTMDTCRTFRRVFGDELQVSHALSAWARFQIQAEEDIEKLKTGGTVVWDRLPREAPDLYAAIMTRGYQSTGAGWMLLSGQAILGDEPGLGKTLQTLAALVEADAKVILVTCPRTATRNVWMRETNRWAPGIATFVAQGSRAEREKVIGQFVDHSVEPFEGARKMLIVNTEMVRARRVEVCSLKDPKQRAACLREEVTFDKHHHNYIPDPEWPSIHKIKWDAVVMDESHRLLASTANTSSKRITQGRFGAMHVRKNVKPHGLAFSLSGTPFRSNLTKAWGQLNWCRPDVWTSFWNFAGTHFGVTEGRYGRVIAEGAKVPEPLDEVQWAKAIGPYILQRDKATAAPDLPSIHYVGSPPEDDPFGLTGIWLEMEPKQAQAYKKMEAMAQVQLKGGTLRAVGILAEITRMRQFAISTGELYRAERRKVIEGNEYIYNEDEFSPCLPSNKIEWLIQFLIEREGYNSKVVVASNFTQVLKLIRAEIKKQLKEECFLIAGETSDRERERVVRKFNDWDDPTRVCLLQTVAGGEAITLDTCCDDLVLIDPCWTSDQEFQLVSRIHRVSRIHQVMVHRLFSLGTVDKWMASNTEEQRMALIAARPDDIIRSLNG